MSFRSDQEDWVVIYRDITGRRLVCFSSGALVSLSKAVPGGTLKGEVTRGYKCKL